MGFNNIFNITIFSEMEGVVLNQGKPVEGAVLNREAVFTDAKTFQDSTVTDAEGRFHFKPITKWSLRPMMLDTNVLQIITICHSSKEFLAWKTFKSNEFARGEIVFDSKNSSKESIQCRFDLSESEEKKQKLRVSEHETKTIWGLCELEN